MWICLHNIESYIQHTGQAGKDGQPLLSVLLCNKGGGRRLPDHNIKACKRDALFANMDNINILIWELLVNVVMYEV